jgi:hypothetical protein
MAYRGPGVLAVIRFGSPLPPVSKIRTQAIHKLYQKSYFGFTEMKLHGLVPNFNIHVSGSDLYIPKISFIWNLFFSCIREKKNSWLNRMSREKGMELPP